MVLKYLLDTNICIYIAKHKPPEVLARFNELEAGEVAMSVVTFGELYNGAMKSQHQAVALQKLTQLLTFIPVLPLADAVGKHYGEIRSHLEQAGIPIGNNDLWIAAHARELALILVTNNLREFERVPRLAAENWVDQAF